MSDLNWSDLKGTCVGEITGAPCNCSPRGCIENRHNTESVGLRNCAAILSVAGAEDRAMRERKRSRHRRSKVPKSGIVLAVANHAAMGVALGLVFALIVTSTPCFGVLPLVTLSDHPETTLATLAGTTSLTFGVSAALTGFILMMEEAER
jgi:hypothetical protein